MIHYVDGDLLTDNYEIFCHQVNCQHVMGGGLARQVKIRYPEVYREYYDRSNPYIGSIDWIHTRDGRICVNMYAQDNFGTKVRQTNYIAFAKCLSELAYYLKSMPKELKVAFPYNIGCGLGGGDWYIISALIEDFSDIIKQEIYIVKKG